MTGVQTCALPIEVPVLVRRMLVEGRPREFFQKTETWQGTLGFRGKLANDWAWEVAGAFGRNTAVDGSTNVANLANVANTLDRTKCSVAAGAATPCADYLGAGDAIGRASWRERVGPYV